MRIISLDQQPWAIQYVVVAAQRLANARGHAITGAQHVLATLLEMPFVRAAIADAPAVARTVNRAVMVTKMGGVKKAELTVSIANALAPQSTLGFLRAFGTGVPDVAQAFMQIAAHGEAIARVLDDSRLQPLLSKPLDEASVKMCPGLTLGFAHASNMQHEICTARHVALGYAFTFQKLLAKKGDTSLDGVATSLAELVDRITPKRPSDGKIIVYEPRLVGVIAKALAEEDDRPFGTRVVRMCFDGDDQLAFAQEPLRAAIDALKADSSDG